VQNVGAALGVKKDERHRCTQMNTDKILLASWHGLLAGF
jgi:hypothetical protein